MVLTERSRNKQASEVNALQSRLSCSEINRKFHKKGEDEKDEKQFLNGEGLSSLQQIHVCKTASITSPSAGPS